MQVITLPNNEKFVIDDYDNNRDIENVIADFCGEEFAKLVMDNIHELECMADYETQKFNSDMGAYEAENETLRRTLQDIESLLKQYEDKFDDGRDKFSRKRVFELFKEIHELIDEVI